MKMFMGMTMTMVSNMRMVMMMTSNYAHDKDDYVDDEDDDNNDDDNNDDDDGARWNSSPSSCEASGC